MPKEHHMGTSIPLDHAFVIKNYIIKIETALTFQAFDFPKSCNTFYKNYNM